MSNASYLGRGRLRRQPHTLTRQPGQPAQPQPRQRRCPRFPDRREGWTTAGRSSRAYATQALRPPRAFGPLACRGPLRDPCHRSTPAASAAVRHPGAGLLRAVRLPVRRTRAGPSPAHGRGGGGRERSELERADPEPNRCARPARPPADVSPAEDATYDGQPRGRAGGRQVRLLPALLRAGHARRYGGLSALRGTLSIAPTASAPLLPQRRLGRPRPCQGVGPQRF